MVEGKVWHRELYGQYTSFFFFCLFQISFKDFFFFLGSEFCGEFLFW